MIPVPAVLALSAAAAAFVVAAALDGALRRFPRVGARLPPGRLPLGASLATGATAALVAGALAVRTGPSASLIALIAVVAPAVYLCALDLRHRLLPNVVVVPLSVGGTALLALASAIDGRPERALTAVLGALALFAVYLALALATPGGLGMGDVKFAALIGAVLASEGWRELVLGAAAGFALAAVAGGALLVLRRARRGSAVPFGPMMLAGAVIVLLTAA